MKEIVKNELYISYYKVVEHTCSILSLRPGQILSIIEGKSYNLVRFKKSFICSLCNKDYSSYMPFIELYLKLYPYS